MRIHWDYWGLNVGGVRDILVFSLDNRKVVKTSRNVFYLSSQALKFRYITVFQRYRRKPDTKIAVFLIRTSIIQRFLIIVWAWPWLVLSRLPWPSVSQPRSIAAIISYVHSNSWKKYSINDWNNKNTAPRPHQLPGRFYVPQTHSQT